MCWTASLAANPDRSSFLPSSTKKICCLHLFTAGSRNPPSRENRIGYFGEPPKGTIPTAKRAKFPSKPASSRASEAKRARHAAWQALVLADIEANGPSRFREVVDRLLGRVDENGVKRSLRAMVLDGRLRVERRAVEATVSQAVRKQRTSFMANVYSIPDRPGKGRK